MSWSRPTAARSPRRPARPAQQRAGDAAFGVLLALGLLACAGVARAERIRANQAPDPDDGPAYGTCPATLQGGTPAHFLNPAMLADGSGVGTCGWFDYRDRSLEVWQTALRVGGASLGYRAYSDAWRAVAVDSAGGAGEPVRPRREISAGLALGEAPMLSGGKIGHRLRMAWGEDDEAWRWDAGLVWFLSARIEAGVVARDLTQGRLDGVLLRRSYLAGLAVGPLMPGGGLKLAAAVEARGTARQRWVDEAILRVGLVAVHRSGVEVRLAVDSRPGDAGRESVLAAALTVPLGRSQLIAAATEDRRAGADQPRCGYGFVEEGR